MLRCTHQQDVQCRTTDNSQGTSRPHHLISNLSPLYVHTNTSNRTAHTDDCNTAVNHNSGCGSSFNKANNYGSGFNSAGGGWYVITRTNADGMAMYFWSRSDNNVPAEVRNGAPNLTPSPSWGKPEASFPSTQCDFSSHFTPHNIIINLTFCVSHMSKLRFCWMDG